MVSKDYQFPEITLKMYEELQKWYKTHNNGKCANSYFGAIGGNITFEITPTSIGDSVVAKCACGESFDMLEL